MRFIRNVKKKDIAALAYIISLLPLLLPWCYFDAEIDGIKYGTDIINPKVFIVLAVATFLSLMLAESKKARGVAKLCLCFNRNTVISRLFGASNHKKILFELSHYAESRPA